MKRYWKLISVSLLICLSLSIFIVYVFKQQSDRPDILISTVKGDETLGESLVIDGNLSGSNEWSNEGIVRVDKNGTHYFSNEPFYRQLTEQFMPPNFEALHKEHRQFMRTNSFYDYFSENDEMVVFVKHPVSVGVNDYSKLKVEYLQKQTGEHKQFVMNWTKFMNSFDLSLETIQVIGNRLFASVTKFTADENHEQENMELYILEIDLLNESIEKANHILTVAVDTYWENDYRFLAMTNAKNDRVIFTTTVGRYEPKSQSTMEDDFSVNNEVVQLHSITKDGNTLEQLPIDHLNGLPIAFDGENVFLMVRDQKGSQITKLNVKTLEITQEKRLDNIHIYDYILQMEQDSLIYFVGSDSPEDLPTKIYALTTDSLEIVYEAKVTQLNHSSKTNYQFYINDLYLKK